jgi:hypothetical protein
LDIKHHHDDGSWAEMEPRDAHDAAGLDEERDWQRGHVYVCRECQETIAISPAEADPSASNAG